MLDNLKKHNDSIVDETIPSLVSLSELQRVLQNLLREGVPVRDLEIILETLSDYAPTIKDTDLLTEYVRQALKRTITRRFAVAGQLKVINLDSAVEEMIVKGLKKHETGSYLSLDANVIQRIIASSTEQIEKMRKLVQEPIVLTSPVIRVYFKKLMDQFFPNITVLSYNDLDPNIQIQSLGIIRI
jgi:flagellar biosynthesis protein FlhA